MVIRFFIMLLFVAGAATAQAAELNAAVDRDVVGPNEHVMLTITLINSDTRLRAEGISPNIDLSVLTRDFDLGTPQVENRYNIYRGRGRSTSSLSVDLFPHHEGRFVIPAFSVDGLNTAPIAITARKLPPGTAPEVFSRAGVNTTRPWQREQLVAWLDVYRRVQLKTASMGEYLRTEPVAIELMEFRELPQSERKETVNGVPYDVTRIAWAIYPKQTGTLTLYLPDTWIVTADDRKLRLPHQQLAVTVRALPAEITADIAVGKPEISQTPPAPAPAVNTLSTWTVTVRGPYSRFALPDILPLPPVTGMKFYSDHGLRDVQTSDNAVTTIVNYTLSALPQHGGTFALPPLRIPYFDTKRGVLDVAEQAGLNFAVPNNPATASAPENVIPDTTSLETRNPQPKTFSVWQLTTLLLAILWIITLTFLWRRPRPRQANTRREASISHPASEPISQHPLQAQLLTAFGSRTLEQGLRDWESRYGVDQSLRDTVRAVQRLCYGRDRNVENDELRVAVTQSVTRIRNVSPTQPAANDPWRPESFAVTIREV